MSSAISLRLPKEMGKALDDLAASIERPKSYLVRRALEMYLAEHADYQMALDRLRDKDDMIVSGKELRKRLGV